MHCSLFKFTLSVLLFWKLLVLKFLLGISEIFLCSMSALEIKSPSARYALATNVVCRGVDVFGTNIVSLNHILQWYFHNYCYINYIQYQYMYIYIFLTAYWLAWLDLLNLYCVNVTDNLVLFCSCVCGCFVCLFVRAHFKIGLWVVE
jgi:hypothetical protein